MNLDLFIANIHILPVVIITIISFVIGALWHQPFLFGIPWKIDNNLEDNQRKVNVPLVFGGTAIMHFIAIAGMSAVISGQGAVNGLMGGFLISVIWVLPTMAGTYLFAGRPLRLLAIDVGIYVVLFSLAGLILGVW